MSHGPPTHGSASTRKREPPGGLSQNQLPNSKIWAASTPPPNLGPPGHPQNPTKNNKALIFVF
eukprot:1060796-Amphidinium_carterae.1